METTLNRETISLLSDVDEIVGGGAPEQVEVWHAYAEAPGDIAALDAADRRAFRQSRTIVVDAARLELSADDVAALSYAAAAGVRVVVAARRPVGGFAPLLVLHEATFGRALSASVYALEAGESLLVISPQSPDSPRVLAPVRHAVRWRGAWAEPEEGDFASRP